MKVLILGGTGVISTSVVKECVRHGYQVTCVNRGKRKNENDALNVTMFSCDANNPSLMKEYLNGKYFDVVIDFLSYSQTGVSVHLDYLEGHVKQYVLISTDSVYKVKKDSVEYKEDDERGNPIWYYSTGKIACEDYLIDFCSRHDMEWTIARPALTFGNTRIPYGLMPVEGYHYFLAERIKHGKYIPIWNEGKNVFTLIHSDDFAKLFVPLLGNEKAYSEIFNVSGDEYVPDLDIINVVSDHLGIPAKTVNFEIAQIVKIFPNKKGEFAVDRACDHKVLNDKIKALSGASLSIPVQEGIERTLDYYEHNNYVKGIDYFFEGQLDKLINSFGKVKEKQSFCNYHGGDEAKHHREYLKGYYNDSLIMVTYNGIKTFFKKVKAKLTYYVTGHY